MKKIYLALLIVAVVILSLSLSACGQSSRINGILKENYSKATLTVISNGAVTLNSRFDIVFGEPTNVTYSVEQLSTFGDGTNIPDNMITTHTGTVQVYKDGSVAGNTDPLPFAVDKIHLNFVDSYFANIRVEEFDYFKFTADVTDVAGFTGKTDFVCSGMKVEFLQNKASTMLRVSYNTDNGNVSVTYMLYK